MCGFSLFYNRGRIESVFAGEFGKTIFDGFLLFHYCIEVDGLQLGHCVCCESLHGGYAVAWLECFDVCGEGLGVVVLVEHLADGFAHRGCCLIGGAFLAAAGLGSSFLKCHIIIYKVNG